MQNNLLPLAGVSPQTKLAVGEIALWILSLHLPADLALARLQEAANGLLANQHHNACTHPVQALKLAHSA